MMKLSVLQENLVKSLSVVSRSVSSKVQLPILNNILLATDKGRLKLSATNLEIGINYWIGAKIEKEGAISIPAKVFTEFVSLLPAEKIDLEVKENNLSLNCGSLKANLLGLPASEFPAVPTLKNESVISFNSNDLSRSIFQVAFAAAQDEGRPVLTGILLMIKNENFVFIATDGYRLSVKKMKETGGIKNNKIFQKGLIIPARAFTEIARLVGDSKQEQKVDLAVIPSQNQLIFSTPEAEIVSRLIEGQFPEFEKIIPEKATSKVIIDTEILIRAVRTASVFARESANVIRWQITKNKLKISANSAQVGENISEVEAKIEGEENKIAFNSRYLLDFLSSVNAEQTSFEMTSPLNPGVFKPAGDGSYFHIIMPVRVQE